MFNLYPYSFNEEARDVFDSFQMKMVVDTFWLSDELQEKSNKNNMIHDITFHKSKARYRVPNIYKDPKWNTSPFFIVFAQISFE